VIECSLERIVGRLLDNISEIHFVTRWSTSIFKVVAVGSIFSKSSTRGGRRVTDSSRNRSFCAFRRIVESSFRIFERDRRTGAEEIEEIRGVRRGARSWEGVGERHSERTILLTVTATNLQILVLLVAAVFRVVREKTRNWQISNFMLSLKSSSARALEVSEFPRYLFRLPLLRHFSQTTFFSKV